MLRKQLDELREEKSTEKMINAKLAAKVCVSFPGYQLNSQANHT